MACPQPGPSTSVLTTTPPAVTQLVGCPHASTQPTPTPRGIGTSAKLGMVSKNNLVEKTSWIHARGAPLIMYPASPTDRGAPTPQRGFLSLACV